MTWSQRVWVYVMRIQFTECEPYELVSRAARYCAARLERERAHYSIPEGPVFYHTSPVRQRRAARTP